MDFIEGPAGHNAYGFASKQAFGEAQSLMAFRSYLNYAHTREMGAAFGNSPDSPFASCSQLIDFCYKCRYKDPWNVFDLHTSRRFMKFCFIIIVYSLQQFNRTFGDARIDDVERSTKQVATTELRRYLES
jgi:hypothetical protein